MVLMWKQLYSRMTTLSCVVRVKKTSPLVFLNIWVGKLMLPNRLMSFLVGIWLSKVETIRMSVIGSLIATPRPPILMNLSVLHWTLVWIRKILWIWLLFRTKRRPKLGSTTRPSTECSEKELWSILGNQKFSLSRVLDAISRWRNFNVIRSQLSNHSSQIFLSKSPAPPPAKLRWKQWETMWSI